MLETHQDGTLCYLVTGKAAVTFLVVHHLLFPEGYSLNCWQLVEYVLVRVFTTDNRVPLFRGAIFLTGKAAFYIA